MRSVAARASAMTLPGIPAAGALLGVLMLATATNE